MAGPRTGAALSRLFQTVNLILFHGSGRLTQDDIAAACGCCVRTVGRDLNALELAGVPLQRDGGYRLDPGFMPFKPQFSLQEAQST